MTLSTEILQNRLNRPFKFFESVNSTNDIAKTWLQEGAPSGAVVIANEQLKGRGRKERTWYTPPNVAIALSIVLRPPQQYLSRMNLIGALSVYDLVEYVGGTQLGIKWPNDVQINRKKVSITSKSSSTNNAPSGSTLTATPSKSSIFTRVPIIFKRLFHVTNKASDAIR